VALVEALHREHPRLTYDVTIKIEHLLKQRKHLKALRDSGCLFVTTAVESLDDRVLELLAKGHTRADFVRAVDLCREAGLPLSPTFVAFTPWITRAGYVELLASLLDLELVDHVAPIQYAIRLLIPESSKLLELEEVRRLVGEFDPQMLCYPWDHPDPAVDRLQRGVLRAVEQGQNRDESRRALFARVFELARRSSGEEARVERARIEALERRPARVTVPYLTEPWYC
jgi:Radical SAM superfamily